VSGPGPDVSAWAKAHAACFEVEPLIELLLGRRVQVGFTISLFARLPMDEQARAERWTRAAEIRATLRQLLESLAPAEGGRARLEIEPRRAAVTLSPEGEMQPEIAVNGRVFHGDEYFAEVTEGEEKRVYEVTRRLTEMGLTERRRRIP
jgi:hypothetical protein